MTSTDHRRLVKITKRKTRQHAYPGLLMCPRGSIAPICYIDPNVIPPVWKIPAEYESVCDYSDVILKKNSSIKDYSSIPSEPKIRCKSYAEPAAYEWTPSCVIYDPKTMRSKWPTYTDSACWWDCHKFTWTPFPLPVKYRDLTDPPKEDWRGKRTRNGIESAEYLMVKYKEHRDPFKWEGEEFPRIQYSCIGNFCGPSCAIAYANDKGLKKSIPLIHHIARMFGYIKPDDPHKVIRKPVFEEECEDGNFDRIISAPQRELLKLFSNQEDALTIEQFREMCTCGLVVKVKDPIFVSKMQIIESDQIQAEAEKKKSEQLQAKSGKKVVKVAMHREDPVTASRQTTAEILSRRREIKPLKGASNIMSFFKQ